MRARAARCRRLRQFNDHSPYASAEWNIYAVAWHAVAIDDHNYDVFVSRRIYIYIYMYKKTQRHKYIKHYACIRLRTSRQPHAMLSVVAIFRGIFIIIFWLVCGIRVPSSATNETRTEDAKRRRTEFYGVQMIL